MKGKKKNLAGICKYTNKNETITTNDISAGNESILGRIVCPVAEKQNCDGKSCSILETHGFELGKKI